MRIRRVATGHNDAGKAIVASDVEVEPITTPLAPGMEFHLLWGSDATPTYPDRGTETAFDQYFPPVGGFRFLSFTVPPAASAAAADIPDFEAAAAEAERRLPGLLGHMEQDDPGFHTTDTIDMGVVTAGEIVLRLDDGAEVTLGKGDTYVQSGTRHAWRNDGEVPSTLR